MLVANAGEGQEAKDVVEREQIELKSDFAGLTLNTICEQNVKTNGNMTLKGYHKKRGLSVLVDIGSLLNFINERLVKRLNCVLDTINPLRVILADGTDLLSLIKFSKFKWEIQGQKLTTKVYVLPISGRDLIRGVPWLITLGTIHWNFQLLTMSFVQEEQNHELVRKKNS